MTQTPPITLDWVKRQRAKLKAELADLDAVERVLMSIKPPAQYDLDMVGNAPVVTVTQNKYATPQPPKKYQMLRAIGMSPNGLTTRALGEQLVAGGMSMEQARNLSPQLSMARADGLLFLDNGVWNITSAGRAYLDIQENEGGGK